MARSLGLLGLLLTLALSGCRAQGQFPVGELTLKGIYGARGTDPTVYCVLGAGMCQPPGDSGMADPFIRDWIARHPKAVVKAISTEMRPFPMPETTLQRETYVWIQDGADSLATALAREGFYPSSAFVDMLERDRKTQETMEKHFRKWKITPPKRPESFLEGDPARRLVTDDEYLGLMRQAQTAESEARSAHRLIWSEDHVGENNASTAAAMSRESFSASELYAIGSYAHRLGDADVYCLLGGSACVTGLPIPISTPEAYGFVTHWLGNHPGAMATPMSVATFRRLNNGPLIHFTYVWVEDAGQSLNVQLVREGFIKAGMLEDTSQTPASASTATLAEMNSPEQDASPIFRIVSEQNYAARMSRAEAAEKEAKQHKKGIWSDEEMARWNPPSDTSLIEKYRRNKAQFARIVELAADNERLAGVNWNPDARNAAVKAGLPAAKVDEYVQLLKKLGVNHELTGVVGIGKVCLVTTDIVYGIFDSGVIKGYVWSTTEPTSIVDDLEQNTAAPSQSSTEVPIRYRHVEGNWYLFELYH
jgi:hypothetical protein